VNKEILQPEVQKFIDDNLKTDVHRILLSKPKFNNVSQKELVEQIESKLKAKTKLPTWFEATTIYYPNKLNLSQTSSEITANYKATLMSGKAIVDVTGGFGVDSFAFSKNLKQVIHIEKNEELSKIAQHNFKQLGALNINCISSDGLQFLQNSESKYDWLYIDPSRRDKDNKKVYYLSDCEPDVTTQIPFLFTKTESILIKTGPLLDIHSGLRELSNVSEIHIIAVNNDVKEVLWMIKKGYIEAPTIKTINFKGNTTQQFYFHLGDEEKAIANYSIPLKYIYEPNASILKSGSFQLIGEQYSLHKLHSNSHLYTSQQLIQFPGRIFEVQHIYNYSKKDFKNSGIKKANITTRNFPDSVVEIRKKLGLKEGGKNYLFCTTDLHEKLILILCFRYQNL